MAVAERPTVVRAIVSRGDRPDLAGSSSYLKQVQVPTLLIVGSKDNAQVIGWNQKAMHQLKNVKEKRMVLVSRAGHLFEEIGTLKAVAAALLMQFSCLSAIFHVNEGKNQHFVSSFAPAAFVLEKIQ